MRRVHSLVKGENSTELWYMTALLHQCGPNNMTSSSNFSRKAETWLFKCEISQLLNIATNSNLFKH